MNLLPLRPIFIGMVIRFPDNEERGKVFGDSGDLRREILQISLQPLLIPHREINETESDLKSL
jgi:hypothetical protein